MYRRSGKSFGFTIVELLIVIVIIAILAVIAVVVYSGAQTRAVETGLKSDLKGGATQLGLAKAETGVYPSAESSLQRSPDTKFEYTYTAGTDSYCLTATSTKDSKAKAFRVENGSVAKEGSCPGHSGPAGGGEPTVSYELGDEGPGGGVVFYDAGSDQSWGRYLEAAPKDWYGGIYDDAAKWGCAGASISGATSSAIGSGKSNTSAIIAACSQSNVAAKLAANYKGGGMSDWFLPSKDELSQLHIRRSLIGGFKTTPAYDMYWSSTQYNQDLAYMQRFGGGSSGSLNKEYDYMWYTSQHVHPIRAFSN